MPKSQKEIFDFRRSPYMFIIPLDVLRLSIEA
jgi:hypothetical protein